MTSNLLIEIKNLSYILESKKILENINLKLDPSKIVTIIGPNGSGKTTLVRCILGIIKPTSGSIWFNPKLKIGYMPQKLNLNKNLPLNVIDFLKLEIGSKVNKTTLDKTIKELGINNILNSDLRKISGGEMQRTLLAKALIVDPTLLILDEPIGGLDINGQVEFYKLIDKLRTERNISILIISHDLHTVMRRSDHVICLHHHICCEGAPDFVNKQAYFGQAFDSETLKTLSIYEHKHDHKHD
jgi:zinc transport system ATP-binding protein